MVTEFGQAELRAAVAALAGARVVEVRRTLNIAIVGFTRGDESVRLHAQCPFRGVYEDRVVIGTRDMNYAIDREPDAFDRYRTQYDRLAEQITTLLTSEDRTVTSASMGRAGALTIECAGGLAFDVLPAIAGPKECWRLFVEGSDEHFVYESGKR
jgi:hypothetical protein